MRFVSKADILRSTEEVEGIRERVNSSGVGSGGSGVRSGLGGRVVNQADMPRSTADANDVRESSGGSVGGRVQEFEG